MSIGEFCSKSRIQDLTQHWPQQWEATTLTYRREWPLNIRFGHNRMKTHLDLGEWWQFQCRFTMRNQELGRYWVSQESISYMSKFNLDKHRNKSSADWLVTLRARQAILLNAKLKNLGIHKRVVFLIVHLLAVFQPVLILLPKFSKLLKKKVIIFVVGWLLELLSELLWLLLWFWES